MPDDKTTAALSITDDWTTGYCAKVTVSTGSTTPVDWTVTIPIEGTVSSLWSADWSVSGGQLTATGKSWNNEVHAGTDTTFGFCADRK